MLGCEHGALKWMTASDAARSPGECSTGAVAERFHADALLLHVGVPKTGTTAVQSCLAAAREVLGEAGVLYPGRTLNQSAAVRSPLRWPSPPEERLVDDRRWRALLRAVRGHTGSVVISSEILAVADVATATRIVDALGRTNVEVVITLRSLAHTLPSWWQQEVKTGLRVRYEQWLRDICRAHDLGVASDADRSVDLWVTQDHGAVVERWAEAVGKDHVTVVVVDPADSDGLQRAFEQLIGLRTGILARSEPAASNRSMTAAEAEVLRRLNHRLADQATVQVAGRRWTLPAPVLRHVLEQRRPRPDEPRLRVPADLVEPIRAMSIDAVTRIRALGPRVVGDLDSLVPTSDDQDPDAQGPQHSPDELPVDAAVLMIEGLLELAADRAERARSERNA